MNVVDHGSKRLRFFDVPIITWPGFPEPMFDTLPVTHRDAREPLGRLLLEVPDRFPSHRFLDGFPDSGNIVYRLARVDNQMNVLGHENVRPEGEIELSSRFIDRCREPF